MNLFTSKGFDESTYEYTYCPCFNVIRTPNFRDKYDSIDRVGVCEELHHMDDFNRQLSIEYLKKAISVIPLLSCLTYHTVEEVSLATGHRWLKHIVSAPTKRVPADKVLQALFLARDILTGRIASAVILIAYERRGTPKPWFDEGRMMNDNKYFTAMLFYCACFKPERYRVLRGSAVASTDVVNLTNRISDGYYFSSAACSLYSIKKFYYGGYQFSQDSLHTQRGYIRDAYLVLQPDCSNTRGRFFRKEGVGQVSTILQKGSYANALSLIMAQGEKRKHFIEGSFYRIEDFVDYCTTWGQVVRQITDEKMPLLIQRLINIIKEEEDQ